MYGGHGAITVHVKLRADGSNLRSIAVHDERTRCILGDVKERLTFDQVDVPLSL